MADAKKKNILIVVDVQNDFITGALRNEQAIKALPNIINLVKTTKFDGVFATLDTHFAETYSTTLEGRKLPLEHCIKGTWGWEIPEELMSAMDDHQPLVRMVEKNTFGSTFLASHLRSLADEKYNEDWDFTIVGFCTDICVVSNALLLRANFPNSNITVHKDCCAGATPKTHDSALQTMKMCQIDIV